MKGKSVDAELLEMIKVQVARLQEVCTPSRKGYFRKGAMVDVTTIACNLETILAVRDPSYLRSLGYQPEEVRQ